MASRSHNVMNHLRTCLKFKKTLLLVLVGWCLLFAFQELEEGLSGQGFTNYDAELPAEDERNFFVQSSDSLSQKKQSLQAALEKLALPSTGRVERDELQDSVRHHFLSFFEEESPEYTLVHIGTERWQSVLQVLEELLQALPFELRAELRSVLRVEYEVEFDALGENFESLQALRFVQRYGFTRQGYHVGRVLGDKAFERADFERAAMAYKSFWLYLKDSREEVENQPQQALYAAKLMYAYAQLGWQQELIDFQAEEMELLSETFFFGEEERVLSDFYRELESVAKNKAFEHVNTHEQASPFYGLTGQTLSQASSDLDSLVWKQEALPLPLGKVYGEAFMEYPRPEVPSIMPIVYQNMVLVNTGSSLSAYDLYNGTPIWEATPYTEDAAYYHLRDIDPNLLLSACAHGELAFACLESPLHSTHTPVKWDARFGVKLYPHYPMVKRSLIAVDLESGEIRWTLGGEYQKESESEEPKSSEEEFIRETTQMSFHAPLYIDGTLYALAARRINQAELFLYAIEPESGKPLWKMSLCQGQQENTLFGRAAREPLPGIPVYAEGRLYICSNLGGCMAVDLEERKLRWVTRYPTLPRPFTRDRKTFYRKPTFANGNALWRVDAEGRDLFIVAATDSRYLMAFDGESGEVVWKYAVEESQKSLEQVQTFGDVFPTVFVGGHEDWVYIAQETSLLQINVNNGELVSEHEILFRGAGGVLANHLQGRPVLGQKQLFWPGGRGLNVLSFNALGAIDQAEVLIKEGSQTFGNLLIAKGVLLNLSGRNYLGIQQAERPALSAFFQPEELLKEAQANYENDPEDLQRFFDYVFLFALYPEQGSKLFGKEAEKILEEALEQAIEIATTEAEVEGVAQRALYRILFDRFLEQAIKAQRAGKKEEFQRMLVQAKNFAKTSMQKRKLFLIQEAFLQQQAEREALFDFYKSFFDVQDFKLSYAFGEAPDTTDENKLELRVNEYAYLRLAEYSQAHGMPAQALEYYFAFYHALGDNPFGLWSGHFAIRRMAELRHSHGEEIFAEMEAQAQKALSQFALEEKDFQDLASEAVKFKANQYLGVSFDYPNTKTALIAIDQALSLPLSQDYFEYVEGVAIDMLELRVLAEDELHFWLDLLQHYKARGFDDGAFHLSKKIISLLEQVQGIDRNLLEETKASLQAAQKEFIEQCEARAQQGEVLGFPLKLEEAWQQVFDEKSFVRALAQPEGEEELLFSLVTESGGQYLIAYDVEREEEVWRTEQPGSEPLLKRLGQKLVVLGDSKVSVLEAQSGVKIWDSDLQGYKQWADFFGSTAYVLVRQNWPNHRRNDPVFELLSIDCQRGKVLWRKSFKGWKRNHFSLYQGDLFAGVQDAEGSKLYHINGGTGEVVAEQALSAAMLFAPLWSRSGYLAYQLSNMRLEVRSVKGLQIIDALTMKTGRISKLHFLPDVMLTLTHQGKVQALKLSDGTKLWEANVASGSGILASWANPETFAVLSVTRKAPREVQLSVLDSQNGKLLYESTLLSDREDLEYYYKDGLAFDEGLALLIRRRQKIEQGNQEGERQNIYWQWTEPRLMVFNLAKGEIAWSYSPSPEDSDPIFYELLHAHQKGLFLSFSNSFTFVPGQSK